MYNGSIPERERLRGGECNLCQSTAQVILVSLDSVGQWSLSGIPEYGSAHHYPEDDIPRRWFLKYRKVLYKIINYIKAASNQRKGRDDINTLWCNLEEWPGFNSRPRTTIRNREWIKKHYKDSGYQWSGIALVTSMGLNWFRLVVKPSKGSNQDQGSIPCGSTISR